MNLQQIINHRPGKDCNCNAVAECKCICEANWAPVDFLFLEWKFARYSEYVRDFMLEYDKGHVSKSTANSLREFATLLNEPLLLNSKINSKFNKWL